VNGKAARDAFEQVFFPAQKLIDVEALRYLSLLEVPRPVTAPAGEVQVLVLGDLIPASMHHLLGLLEGAVALGATRMQLTIKPHPAFDVDPRDYPGLRAQATREPLSRVLSQYRVAISANCTSAAVEAFIAGLSVIIAVDGEDLNLSPLRGHPGVRFVSTAEELFTELMAVTAVPTGSHGQRDGFFFLSQGLPRWQRLFESVAPRGVNA
jgi:surface carbohydrate biosynthesis protein (TIGR04326 family)